MTGHSRSRASVPRSAGEAAPAMTTARSRSAAHRHYARRRNREIAYGRWQPWASATPVRDHVRLLRASGLSYQAIARAAGVSPMTVRRLLHGQPSRQRDIPRAHPHRPGKKAAGHQRWHPEASGGKTECGRDTAPAASPDRHGPPSSVPGPPAGHGPPHAVGHRLRNDRHSQPRDARGDPPPVRANVGPTPAGTHPARAQGCGRRPPTGRAVGLAYADGPR